MLSGAAASQFPIPISSAMGSVCPSLNPRIIPTQNSLGSYFFKSSALHELYPYQKSLDQLRVCAQDGSNQALHGELHTVAPAPSRQQFFITASNDQTAAVNLLAFYTYFS